MSHAAEKMMADDDRGSERAPRGIRIFRGEDEVGLFESGTMSRPVFDAGDQAAIATEGPRSPLLAEGVVDRLRRMNEAAAEHGNEWVEQREFQVRRTPAPEDPQT